jgi:hypothetical protein
MRIIFDGEKARIKGNRISAADCCDVCCTGVEYFNANQQIITIQNFDAGPPKTYDIYNGMTLIGTFSDQFPRFVRYCERYLIYDGATHDGATYDFLPTPIVIGPWQSGTAIPNETPFVTSCWDATTIEYTRIVEGEPVPFPAEYGLSYSFTVDPDRLWKSLYDQTFIDAQPIPVTACDPPGVGVPHKLILFCVFHKIRILDPAVPSTTYYDADTRIVATLLRDPTCNEAQE